MLRRLRFVNVTWLLLSSLCLPLAHAGSNLAGGLYPAPDCGDKPQTPVRPEVFESEAEITQYNAQVEAYNVETQAYFACVQLYVDNAAQDITTIRTTIQAVIDQAND